MTRTATKPGKAAYLVLVAASCLAVACAPRKPGQTVTRSTDHKPILTVTVTPANPTTYRDVALTVRATDDSGLAEIRYQFVELDLSTAIEASMLAGHLRRELERTDSLIPTLLGMDAAAKLGDSLTVIVAAVDLPNRQVTEVKQVIRPQRRK
ncbi:MAG: hypothetical protein NTX53_06280 [candidate division WOR-3 bacterium]|nr:hypothetical protein [candidate division WOR-3 bacterium]